MSLLGKEAVEDRAAAHALDMRRRIEAAVDCGEVPSWVLQACEIWERSALAYGAAMARRELVAPPMQGSHRLN